MLLLLQVANGSGSRWKKLWSNCRSTSRCNWRTSSLCGPKSRNLPSPLHRPYALPYHALSRLAWDLVPALHRLRTDKFLSNLYLTFKFIFDLTTVGIFSNHHENTVWLCIMYLICRTEIYYFCCKTSWVSVLNINLSFR